jgi:hypothetical protein
VSYDPLRWVSSPFEYSCPHVASRNKHDILGQYHEGPG